MSIEIAHGLVLLFITTSAHALKINVLPRNESSVECHNIVYVGIKKSICMCEATEPLMCSTISPEPAQCPNDTAAQLCMSSGRTVAINGSDSVSKRLEKNPIQHQPKRAILFTYPKTASTSLFVAFADVGMDVIRYHNVNGEIQNKAKSDLKACSDTSCLVVSTVRKPGPALVSLYFQTFFGTWDTDCNTACKKKGDRILNMSSDERLQDFFTNNAKSQLKKHYAHPWSKFSDTFQAAGYKFDLEQINSIANRPQINARLVDGNMTWQFLQYDEKDQWNKVIQQHVPNWDMKRTLDSDKRVYKDQYHEMKKILANQQAWPVDLWKAIVESETMKIFYPNEMPM